MADAAYLQPDERILLEAGRHPASFAVEVAAILLLLGLAVAGTLVPLAAADGPLLAVGLPLAGAWAAGALLWGTVAYLRVRTSRYLLTEARVYHSRGRFRFFLVQTTYDKLTDVHVRQGLLGRRYGYGSLRVGTAGTGVRLVGVPDPFGFKRRLEEARTAFVASLVAEHRASRAPRAASLAPGGTAAVAWEGRPARAFFLSRALGLGWPLLLGTGLLVTGLLVNPGLLLPGGALVAFSGIGLLAAWLQFRYTHFAATSRGVVIQSGWLTRRRVETTYEKITDVTLHQGVLGRLLDYGDIRINTAGASEAPVVFHGLAEPERVKAILDEARRRARP